MNDIKPTVMIVDDNVQNVELLQAFLEALPVKIVTAFDGVEALEKVDSADAQMILQWCSRALNTWGVHLQRSEKIKEAGIDFARAVALNTNNLSARI